MADVNLQIVREFFELNLFHVLTFWQQDPQRQRATEHGTQLFVRNTRPVEGDEAAFLLHPGDVVGIGAALVEVRAWHTDRFYPSVVESNPVLFQFAKEESLERTRELIGGDDFTTILVLSELPTTPEHRTKALQMIQDEGIGHVLEFPVIFQDLLERISINTNYAASPTLQLMRLLKRYRFIRNQQMEFRFPTEAPHPVAVPIVDTVETPPEPEDEDEEPAR